MAWAGGQAGVGVEIPLKQRRSEVRGKVFFRVPRGMGAWESSAFPSVETMPRVTRGVNENVEPGSVKD